MSQMFRKLYHAVIVIGTKVQPLVLLAVRLYWGISFMQTGLGKFENHQSVVQYFQSLNIAYAEASAYLVAFIETFGGLALALGLFARLFSIPLIAVLCTALATAHREALLNIFHDPDTFTSQAPFLFLMASLIVFCFGPGKISIDYLKGIEEPDRK
jgi:putative oxidoreductase